MHPLSLLSLCDPLLPLLEFNFEICCFAFDNVRKKGDTRVVGIQKKNEKNEKNAKNKKTKKT